MQKLAKMAAIVAMAFTAASAVRAEDVSGDQLVDALNGIFGKHPAAPKANA